MKLINVTIDIIEADSDKNSKLESRVICLPGQVLKAVDLDKPLKKYAEVLVYSFITELDANMDEHVIIKGYKGNCYSKPVQQALHYNGPVAEVCGGHELCGMLRIPVQGAYGQMYGKRKSHDYRMMEQSVSAISVYKMLKAARHAVPMTTYVSNAGVPNNSAMATAMLGTAMYARYSDELAAYIGNSNAVRLCVPGGKPEDFLQVPIPTILSQWEDVIGKRIFGVKDDDDPQVLDGYADMLYNAVCDFMNESGARELFIGHKFNPVITGLDTTMRCTVKDYRTLENTDHVNACVEGDHASLRNIIMADFDPSMPFGAIDASQIEALAEIMRSGSVLGSADIAGTLL